MARPEEPKSDARGAERMGFLGRNVFLSTSYIGGLRKAVHN